ncbi:MAG: hypothetical protein ACI8ZN_000788 [Bacteroidia bacterium]|jgi:hypothetical protein
MRMWRELCGLALKQVQGDKWCHAELVSASASVSASTLTQHFKGNIHFNALTQLFKGD